MVNFRFERDRHDDGRKSIFGKAGNFDWRDSCRLCIDHPAHAGLLRRAALVLLRADAAAEADAQRPQAAVPARPRHPPHRRGDPHAPAPLRGPADGEAADRPDRRHAARAAARASTTDAWTWISDEAGQRLFQPPNVAGWDEQRWLDTARLGGRWSAAAQNDRAPPRSTPTDYDAEETAAEAVRKALRFWGNPSSARKTTRRAAAIRGPGRERRHATTGSRTPTGRCARTRCGC